MYSIQPTNLSPKDLAKQSPNVVFQPSHPTRLSLLSSLQAHAFGNGNAHCGSRSVPRLGPNTHVRTVLQGPLKRGLLRNAAAFSMYFTSDAPVTGSASAFRHLHLLACLHGVMSQQVMPREQACCCPVPSLLPSLVQQLLEVGDYHSRTCNFRL